jgi:hypothetical protein
MKHLVVILAICLSGTLFASGDTTHVTTRYKDGKVNEQFVRNKNGEKDGSYIRYTRYGKKYIVGQYADGIPVGIWEFYSSDVNGVLVQKLDFDTHKELFVDSLRVPSLICGPRYFGGNMLEYEYIGRRIRSDFTAAERNQYKGKVLSVNFTIDKVTLKPAFVSCADQTLPKIIQDKMVKIVSEMPAWLPPVCKAGDAVWNFSVPFAF